MFNKMLSKIKDSLRSGDSIMLEQYITEENCRDTSDHLKKSNDIDTERYQEILNIYLFKEESSMYYSANNTFSVPNFDSDFSNDLIKNVMVIEEGKRNLQNELNYMSMSKEEKALAEETDIFLECMEVLRESDEQLAESLKAPELKVETFSNMDFEELLNQDYPLEYVDRSNVQFLLNNMDIYIKEKERQESFNKKQKQSFALICKVYKLKNGSLRKGVKVDF